MSTAPQPRVRLAQTRDAHAVAQLLHHFNEEFGDPTPGPAWLARRIGELLSAGELTVLLIGEPPDGLAVLRFRPAIFSAALECYLAELYVAPGRRGRGLGRELLAGVEEVARSLRAGRIVLDTAAPLLEAAALYRSAGYRDIPRFNDNPVAVAWFGKDLA